MEDNKNMNQAAPLPAVSMKPSLPTAFALIGYSFSLYKHYFKVIAGIVALPAILNIGILFLFPEPNAGTPQTGLAIFALFASLVVSLFSYIAQLALYDVVSHENQNVKDAYKRGLKMFFPAFLVNLLVGFAVIGGFFLFVVPGLLLSVWLSMSMLTLFAEDKRGMSALVSSWHYTKGYWGAIFWRGFVFGALVIIASLLLGLVTAGPSLFEFVKTGVAAQPSPLAQLPGLLFNVFLFYPLFIIFPFSIYRSLKQIKEAVPSESDAKKIRKNITLFAVLGGVGFLIIIGGSVVLGFLSAGKALNDSGTNPTPGISPISSFPATVFPAAALMGHLDLNRTD